MHLPAPLRLFSPATCRRFIPTSLLLLGISVSCAPAQVKQEPCYPPPVITHLPEDATAGATQAPEEAAPEAKAEPSPQDVAAAQLAKDYQALLEETDAELARLSPETRAATLGLTKRWFGATDTAMNLIMASQHRRPANAARDASRHPAETLAFLGITPKQTVLEYGPGGGWYTELLAPLLARQGRLLVTLSDPNGPSDARATYYGKRTMLFLHTLQEAYSGVTPYIPNAASQTAIPASSVDAVLVIRGLHGMVNQGQLGPWLAEFHRTLKPGGVLGIVQHRAAEGTDPLVTSKQGYLPQSFVVAELGKAGFRLEAQSELNANPKDTREHPDGVWTLPPTLKLGDTDRDKYLAIGESDRMTLKFVKATSVAIPQ